MSDSRCARDCTRRVCIWHSRRIGAEDLAGRVVMQETIARIPAQERIVHVSREDVGRVPGDAALAGIHFPTSPAVDRR